MQLFRFDARDLQQLDHLFNLDAFLACGILAHGFLRLRCTDCAHGKLVAFSCYAQRETICS
jgi:Transposase zinc-binding domain